jgi:hypothetical protein
MKRIIYAMALCLIGFVGVHAQKPSGPSEFFPMATGTYWIYKGTVRWFDPEGDQPGSAEVTWKMTVERVIRRKGIVAAVMTGFPADLDWSAGTTEPKPWLFIEDEKHRVFFENLGPDFDLSRLNGDDHVFDKFMVDDNLFFQWPVSQGAKFCDEEAKKREDGNYCWNVAEMKKKKLQGVSGAPAEERPVFRMEYWTLPDDQKIELAPGVGVLSYNYHHHGTVADTELQLVEFHPAPDSTHVQGPKP